MSQSQIGSDGPQEGDQVDRADDVPAATDLPREETRRPGIADQVRSSDLVADLTLAQGVTYTPDQLRVLRTSYVFKVNQVVRGNPEGEYVTINDTGGVYPDGSTVSTEHSFKLSPGGRYMVFADRVGDDLWLRQILQIHDDGAVVADASGRVLVGIREGVPIAQAQPSYEALRYIQPVTRNVEPMEGAPDEASVPLPDRPEAAALDTARQAAISLDTVIEYLSAAERQESRPEDVLPTPRDEGAPPEEEPPQRRPQTNIEGRSQESAPGIAGEGTVQPDLSGNHVAGFQSHFHFMPDDNNWAWTSHCRGSWNALVNNNLGLFAYKITTSNSQPIRDRLPVANNNQNNVGVLSNAQMTSGGYDTWPVLSANGVCYTWTSGNRVRETDILINPAIAGNEAQFRKSLTHEYGHALTLLHEAERMALLYPGTFRQPPNYSSLWYSRRADHQDVRSMLDWVNSNVAAGTWDIAQFADMATWSQAHDNPGTAGNLVMTRLSTETVSPGDTVTVQFVHLENRGNVPAQNVRLKFYLSTNEVISASDHEIGSFTWSTFTSWWSGSLNVQIPASIPAGQYYVGWIVTTDTAERSSSNNQAILMRDHNAGFAKVRITVN
jgi:hypothetical protein